MSIIHRTSRLITSTASCESNPAVSAQKIVREDAPASADAGCLFAREAEESRHLQPLSVSSRAARFDEVMAELRAARQPVQHHIDFLAVSASAATQCRHDGQPSAAHVGRIVHRFDLLFK